jgi:hypothetical protein
MNDGNDSNIQRDLVMEIAKQYKQVFFNTSINKDLANFKHPVVLTANPSTKTDTVPNISEIPDPPANLMFVRVRTNAWNTEVVDKFVEFYTKFEVPTVLTFMGYYTQDIPKDYLFQYEFKKRTLNSYYVLTKQAYLNIVNRYQDNPWVYTCGKYNTYSCSKCGNCIREYYNTVVRCKH